MTVADPTLNLEGFRPRPVQESGIARQRGENLNTDVTAQRQAALLGDFYTSLFPEGTVLRRGDIPLLETGLNFENRQNALRDRQQGMQRLEDSRSAIGSSPESILARQIAVSRARGEGPLSQGVIDNQRGALRSAGALAGEAQQRELAMQLAQRGLGGGVPAVQQAALQQQLATDIGGRLASFDLESAQLLDTAQRQAAYDLQTIADQEELRRIAIDQLIAEAFFNTDRSPIDLSGLLGSPPGTQAPIGFGTV